MSSVDSVLARLESPEWSVRAEAARELASIDDPRARDGVIRALNDAGDTAVTRAAAEAIVESGDERYLDDLISAMDGNDDFDRAQEVYEVLLEHEPTSPLAAQAVRRDEQPGP